ncbi:hypothetical protein [Dyadobacter sp. Leaf189]|uniref:hypothetical protein n=1 Tax=Dyadobacter sp. Leaf189 TaxID=1736295 RepID=UPI0006FA59C1|nr:hypothetical protein [Dyadobacter sp. Leaf189]KQS23821.1 hypothetical protein ASG33_24695 [Dyadobacter sp. Leaf189]
MKYLFIVALCLVFSGSSFSQGVAFGYDAAGNRIKRSSAADLTPTIDINALLFAEAASRDFVLNMYEINNVETSGLISFRISKISAFKITYPLTSGTSNVLGGVANQNSSWDFTENANFVIITSKAGIKIAQGGKAVVGFKITRNAGQSANITQNITAVIVGGAGGEVNSDNNQAIVQVSTL